MTRERLRVVFVSTADIVGGAAVATYRLVEALRREGVDAQMIVRDKRSTATFVHSVPRRRWARWWFVVDRLLLFCHLHLRRTNLWLLDANSCGTDITQQQVFRTADLVHLAWINQALLSRGDLRKVFAAGKPVVWTLHDLWPVVSLCHYPRRCEQYLSSACAACPLLPRRSLFPNLSQRVWRAKKTLYDGGKVQFVACSDWLATLARRSLLSRRCPVATIPNAIDTSVFRPLDRRQARQTLGIDVGEKKVLLFVAQKISDERKGAALLIEALAWLRTYRPAVASSIVVALVGACASEVAARLSLPTIVLGYVAGDDRLAQVYNAADVFVLPSMEDNLPNTVMEALACGVPAVAFNVGGVAEMISHKENGYVAQAGSSASLAEGIQWVLTAGRRVPLSANAVRTVAARYASSVVAQQYISLYQQLLAARDGSTAP